jgi:hypothetical protein
MAEKWAAVHAGDETLDHVAGPKIEPGNARDRLGMEKTAGIFVFDFRRH